MLMIYTTGCNAGGNSVQKSGDVVKEDRQVASFKALDVSGAFHIFLSQGNTESLTLECDGEHISDVVTEVKGETLFIYLETAWKNIDSRTMNVYLTFRDLESIELSGAVSLESRDKLKFGDLELDISGAAELEVPMSAEKIEAELSGAAEISLYGTAVSAEIEISGASTLNAEELEVENMSLEVSGASTVKVFVTVSLDAEISGAASVKYKGDPKVNVERSGVGSFKKM